jgi:hypothetical protein
VDETLQQVFAYTPVLVYMAGGITLFVRGHAKQVDYLRRFPPAEGVRLDTFKSGNPFGAVNRAIIQVSREPQEDPDLERLRQAMRRSSRQFALWLFGFPPLTLGVVMLLILAGWVHPH